MYTVVRLMKAEGSLKRSGIEMQYFIVYKMLFVYCVGYFTKYFLKLSFLYSKFRDRILMYSEATFSFPRLMLINSLLS
jgi:hypothetical protein